MGIYDPEEVITLHSLREAIEDGALVEIFKKRWGQLSGGKPIVASAHLVEDIGYARAGKIWKQFAHWKENAERTLSQEERLFSTEINGQAVWVIEDVVAYTMMYQDDY